MVIPHPLFVAPENLEKKIWRYMDLTKFISLLMNESIYFPRSDYFEDVFEGSLPKIVVENVENAIIKKYNLNENYTANFLKGKNEAFKSQKENYAISCWHMNDSELAAMWKIYLQSNEEIVIQSTYLKLLSELSQSKYDFF